jgi:adenosylcobinamide kinase (EC 2.7.1.156)
MSQKVIVITGGQRSGKSSYAQKLALSLSSNPVYLATSRVWDEEHRARIVRHQGGQRTGMDQSGRREISQQAQPCRKVVLVDCVTLWATNFFFDNKAMLPCRFRN